MVTIEKATINNFEEIYPFLKAFDNSHNKNGWRKIFDYSFSNNEGYCGYILRDNREIVGFLGYIFSKRIINNREEKFCNITSWIVKKKYRNNSLSLLYPILKLKDYTITNISSGRKELYQISKKLGFKDLDSYLIILYPLFKISSLLKKKSKVITIKNNIGTFLAKDQSLYKLFKEHINYKCCHLLVETKEGKICYIVFTKVKRKKISFAYIHYISDIDIFIKNVDKLKISIIKNYKIFFIIIEKRFLKGNNVSFSFTNKLCCYKVFKSNCLDKYDIDNLYSELILLNI